MEAIGAYAVSDVSTSIVATERAVLGCVLADATTLANLAVISPDHFYDPRHGLILQAMRQLSERDESISVLELQRELGPRLEAAGGVRYLAALQDDLPDGSLLERYKEYVLEAAARRELSVDARDLARRSAEWLELEEAAERVTASVQEIRSLSWPEPHPLPAPAEPPPITSSLLPEAVSAFAFDLGERMSAPPEYAVVPLLVSIGSMLGRRVAIAPKRFDTWIEYPNLWGAIVGPPGSMKSPALSESLRFVRQVESTVATTWDQDEQVALAVRREELALQLKNSEHRGSQKNGEGRETAAEIAAMRHELCETDEKLAAGPRRLTTSDTTIEKLMELLRLNPRGLLLTRDELAGWLLTLEREGRKGEREAWLELWGGHEPLRIDRIGRGSLAIPPAVVSVVGGIQPGKLRRYVEEAARGGFGSDGLLQRFGLLIWPNVPEFKYVDRPPAPGAAERLRRIVLALDDPDIGKKLGGSSCSRDRDVVVLRLDSSAQEFGTEWMKENGKRTRAEAAHGSELLAASYAKSRKTFVALALVFHAIEVADGRCPPGAVPLECVRRAAGMCELLQIHTRKAYGEHVDDSLSRASALASKIHSGVLQDGISLRDLSRHHWRNLSTPEDVRVAVDYLSDLGWCRVGRAETGGRPSQVLRLNPRLLRAS